MGSIIHSIGLCSGEIVLTNEDLEKILAASEQQTSNEWIVQRTGISRRRVSRRPLGDLAVDASKDALNQLDVVAEPIDHIIVATNTQRHPVPNLAGFLHKELHMSHPNLVSGSASGVDLVGGCGGINFALMYANDLISNGSIRSALVLGAEKLSEVTNYADRKTSILFGDGASAYILGKGRENEGFIRSLHNGNGNLRNLITYSDKPKIDLEGALNILNGGAVPSKTMGAVLEMDGPRVFKYVVEQWSRLIGDLGEFYDSIKGVAPHLANLRCLEAVEKEHPRFLEKCGLTNEENLYDFHNTSTASQGRRVKQFIESVKPGDHLLMFGYGAGLQACANIYRKP